MHVPSLDVVRRMLSEAALPVADVIEERDLYFAAIGSPESPDGIVGLEITGAHALLRSLVVAQLRRGTGVGRSLVAHAEQIARDHEVATLFLLTTTADGFFRRLGYLDATREGAPPAIRATREFSELCPESSHFMTKSLDT